MKKSTKTLLKVACGIGIAGIVLILIGVGMGATWNDARTEGKWAIIDRDVKRLAGNADETEAGTSLKDGMETEEKLSVKEVTGLEFDIEAAGVYVETWDQDYISIRTNGELYNYRAKLEEDGTYEMESEARLRQNQGMLWVYLPEEMVLEKLEMDIGAGEAQVEGVTAKRVSADVGAGALTFEGTILGNAEFDCGAGETVVRLNGNPEDFNYDLSCGMGELELNGESYGGISRDRRIDNGAPALIRLKCGVGRIELNVEE